MDAQALAGRDRLPVRRHASRQAMGEAAAGDIAAELRARLTRQAGVRMVFAAAPSQAAMLDALWPRGAGHRLVAHHRLPHG